MSLELSIQLAIAANKTPTLVNVGTTFSSSPNFDMAGNNAIRNIQYFNGTPAQIDIGAVATVGYVYIRNTAGANNLLVRIGSGGTDVIKISPGRFALFEAAANTLFVSASGGATIAAEVIVYDA